MLRLSKLSFPLVLIIGISCSIIKDSDVSSLDQFNKLKLTSFDIVENDGNISDYHASLKYDSVENFDTQSKFGNYHITRLVGYSLPTLGGRKLQILGNNISGQNYSNTIRIYYRSDGKPYRLEIFAGAKDSVVAYYRFLYYSSGQLASLTTDINPIDDKPSILHTKDTLFYSSTSTSSTANNLTGVTRRAGSGPVPFSIQYSNCTSCGGSGIVSFSATGSVGLDSYQIQSGSNCNNEGGNSYGCGSLQYQIQNPNGPYPQVQIQVLQSLGKTSEIDLTDLYNRGDFYYFHPLMILKDVIPQGDVFLWIYACDWWKYSTAGTSTQNNSNFGATVRLNYGK